MTGGLFLKDPDAVLDYRMDWTDALAEGVALSTSTWSVSPAIAGGLEVRESALDGGVTVVHLAGGVAGHVYRVSNEVTMSDGNIDGRSLVVRVEER